MKGIKMPKLLVVDKSIFHGLCDEKLCAIAKDYNVVLPDVLAVECLISKDRKEKLLRRFGKAIKAGAKMGCSSSKLFREEKAILCPAKSIVDEDNTKLFRNGTPNANSDFIKQQAEYCQKAFEPRINLLSKYAGTLYKDLCDNEKLSKDFIKKDQMDKVDRLKEFVQGVDKKVKDILKHLFSEKISSHADASWFTWQMTRLWWTYCFEWTYENNLPGSAKNDDISNNFYDIEYVTYLLWADGLLTGDKDLVSPLAKAAFPKKDIFVVNPSRSMFDDIVKQIPKSYKVG
jgi:hypothetical protein